MVDNCDLSSVEDRLLKKTTADEILPLVYDQLRKLAEVRLAKESVGQTLQATALVHEVYLRLTEKNPNLNWNGLNHFFGAAAIAMRRILVERARHKKTLCRGGKYNRKPMTQMDQLEADLWNQKIDVVDLNEALDELAGRHPRQAKLVELRFFLGMTIEEAASVLEISPSTADLDWRYARAFLKLELATENF